MLNDDYQFNPNETYHEEVFSEAWKYHRSRAYFDYRERWDKVPREKVSLPFPIHLDIETTTYCNLSCPMCPRTVMIEQGTFGEGNGFMSFGDFCNIIDQGAKHGLSSVKLNYLGEPLMHKDVVQQVSYAKVEGGLVDVILNTNGTPLTPKKGEELLRAGLDGLFVSFDAINPRDWEAQRVGSTIGRVIDNLYAFSVLRDKIRPGCQIRVSMVMYKEPKWFEQFEAMKVMWKGIVDAVGYGFIVEHSETADKEEYPEVPGFWCAQPFQRMFLKYCGHTTICCYDSADQLVMGNWREEKLVDIWNSGTYLNVRGCHAEGNYREMALCRKCYLPVSGKVGG